MSTRPTPNIKMYPEDTACRHDRFCSEMTVYNSISDAFVAWDAHEKMLEEKRRERRNRAVREG
ncbi:hypothetical protein [Deinococcus arenicola]|uniref:Uncharacterized protein n=1 Tax=Deinococcus arenicola TaxID=2994950 RepID=A0ABU4DTA3_9DEIO|nr:hypothetical protein [Deinococcus sp. ZS9-10]MDV6375655.1 hypothetical protein [Deinococcus sp. ZS9-10]